MSDTAEELVYQALRSLGIAYTRHEHPPVFTVDEAEPYWRDIDATHCKNLFVRNKKGDNHYLVIAAHATPVDLKRLAALLGEDRLSFASAERLHRLLGLSAGAVSPFGLLNDSARAVTVVVDKEVAEADRVAFHPNVNTATVALAAADFLRYLAASGQRVHIVPF